MTEGHTRTLHCVYRNHSKTHPPQPCPDSIRTGDDEGAERSPGPGDHAWGHSGLRAACRPSAQKSNQDQTSPRRRVFLRTLCGQGQGWGFCSQGRLWAVGPSPGELGSEPPGRRSRLTALF